jgi:hypothetical protein
MNSFHGRKDTACPALLSCGRIENPHCFVLSHGSDALSDFDPFVVRKQVGLSSITASTTDNHIVLGIAFQVVFAIKVVGLSMSWGSQMDVVLSPYDGHIAIMTLVYPCELQKIFVGYVSSLSRNLADIEKAAVKGLIWAFSCQFRHILPSIASATDGISPVVSVKIANGYGHYIPAIA